MNNKLRWGAGTRRRNFLKGLCLHDNIFVSMKGSLVEQAQSNRGDLVWTFALSTMETCTNVDYRLLHQLHRAQLGCRSSNQFVCFIVFHCDHWQIITFHPSSFSYVSDEWPVYPYERDIGVPNQLSYHRFFNRGYIHIIYEPFMYKPSWSRMSRVTYLSQRINKWSKHCGWVFTRLHERVQDPKRQLIALVLTIISRKL